MSTAVVVGSGPNGLAAAITLAQHGVDVTVLERAETVGGGTRTAELTVPGVLHDVCSAVHPLGVASPFLTSLGLEEHGLRWRWAELDAAHPLDGGRAGVLHRSIEQTADGLGADGPAWRSLFGPMAERIDVLTGELFRPFLHVPRHPVTLARFGWRALPPATLMARRWVTDEARALFAGVAAHMMQPLERVTTSSVAVLMIAAGHSGGWPVAEGGSAAITDAMVSVLTGLGGTVLTSVDVRSLDDLPPRDITLLDVAPSAVVAMAGDRLPPRVRRAYRRWRHGAAAFKVDLAVEGEVPWTNTDCRRAGTVHVGGTIAEIAAAERQVHEGRMPARPFVLVAQQHLADPTRSSGDVHPVWAYAHVPPGYDRDATDVILDQIERFAPGLRDRIVGRHVAGPAALERYNPNYVGGDIATGASSPVQLLVRPRFTLDPYDTGIPGTYLCSAATPPGAGVHGMCGHLAAQAALGDLTGRR